MLRNDDDELSVSGSEFWGESSPFLGDRCVFSIGGDDEGDGHLDDHDLLSAASSETLEGNASECSSLEEIPSPSLASASSFAKDEATTDSVEETPSPSSAASCETVEGEASESCAVEEILSSASSPSSDLAAQQDALIQSIMMELIPVMDEDTKKFCTQPLLNYIRRQVVSLGDSLHDFEKDRKEEFVSMMQEYLDNVDLSTWQEVFEKWQCI